MPSRQVVKVRSSPLSLLHATAWFTPMKVGWLWKWLKELARMRMMDGHPDGLTAVLMFPGQSPS